MASAMKTFKYCTTCPMVVFCVHEVKAVWRRFATFFSLCICRECERNAISFSFRFLASDRVHFTVLRVELLTTHCQSLQQKQLTNQHKLKPSKTKVSSHLRVQDEGYPSIRWIQVLLLYFLLRQVLRQPHLYPKNLHTVQL